MFLCNPNNPTGQVMNRLAVRELAEVVERQQGWLIVDEAFIDYCQEQSVVSMLRAHPRMVVLRSLTKFYAMPGLRIGYLLGASKVVDLLKDRQPPWSVNSLAQEVSRAVLHDHAYATQKPHIHEERTLTIHARASAPCPAVRIYPSAANFVLIELPDSTCAGVVTDRLASKRLLVRDCSMLPGLTTQMIRVAIRTTKENRGLIAALRACLRMQAAMRKLRRRAMQTAFSVRRKTLIVDLGSLRSVLSSAPVAGGTTRARYILNHQVAAKPIGRDDYGMGAGARYADPARTLSKLATSLGIRDKFVGLMTAVSLADLVTVREVCEPDLGRRICHGRDFECRAGGGTGYTDTAHQQLVRILARSI